jgi:energy-coupling factor transporter ATP-binding protein EcfA2
LGYRETDFDRKAREMSGGWIMRARLARLLVMEPDLLLLDEPTNHLDLLSLLWLQNYLKNYSGALLLISHDRQFMDEVVTQVHEIAERKLIPYTGNYTDYLRQREERYEQQLAAHNNQQKEITALQEFADRFRAVPSKASQAMSKLKQIERMERSRSRSRRASRFASRSLRRRAGDNAPCPCGHSHGLWRDEGLRRARPDHRTRRAHGARRAERRGQEHAAQDSRGRRAVPEGRTQSRSQREDRLLQPASRRYARSGQVGAGRSAGQRAAHA